MKKQVLDACCGSKMFYFDKTDGRVLYMDNRREQHTLCDGRVLNVNPDIIADFRNMPFESNTFHLVVFDPPHLLHAGAHSWLALKYGRLGNNWKDDIRRGFAECFRVLQVGGTLIFKWNEDQIKLHDILLLTPYKPLFGDRRAKTHWVVFYKDHSVDMQSEKSETA